MTNNLSFIQIPIYRSKYTSILPYSFTQTERFSAETNYFSEICLSASIFQSQTLIYQCNPLFLRNDLPSHPSVPVIEVVADDAELPNLQGVAHVIPRPAFQPENKPFYEQNQPRSRKSFVYLQECK